ncbi:anti-sigma factor domain-containing protein [Kribbella sp. NPDC058693]|uniref:anti-sigma factor domain-containing protein n=1 Tax=Kribbella sp. NPDC058693 TaxID=3346602 RepID=UPI00364E2AB8
MTTHLDDELLAQWALDGDEPDPADADHLQHCAQCRDSLNELRAVAAARGQLPRLELPPDDVWLRVSAEVDLESRPTATAPQPAVPADQASSNHRADGPGAITRLRQKPAKRRWRGFAVAASVGVAAGVIGTLLVTSDDNTPPPAEAVIQLQPLAGKSGDGSADLIRDNAGNQLKVAASGLANTPGFYEVWLINLDGKRMVSLGVLNPQTGGTFQIPPDVTAQGYRIVDVSLEPDDGNPEHSHNSIIRGTLPS